MTETAHTLPKDLAPAERDEPRLIPADEIEPHPFSIGDPAGKLFTWKGGLYRGIREGCDELYRQLAASGRLEEWAHSGFLAHARLTDFTLRGYGAVFSHRRIEPVSLPAEWPPAMLRDAVLHTLDFGLELSRHGLIIKDPHPWNTVFDGAHPVYVDLTSIVRRPAGTLWPGYRNFRSFCYNPLLLMSKGYDRLARLLMEDDQGIPSSLARQLTGRALGHPFRRWERSLRQAASTARLIKDADETATLLGRLRKLVEAIELPQPASPAAQPTNSQSSIIERVRRSGARSVLDLNCSSVDFPLALAAQGIQVAAFAPDAGAATSLYELARKTDADIAPLFMDFLRPTPGRGLGNCQSIPAEERFTADLAVVRGVSPRLFERRPITPRQMAEGLARFRCPVLLLQCEIEAPGEGVSTSESEVLSALEAELRRRFASVTVSRDGNAVLLECRREGQ